jgi:hypothetical protein
MPRLLPALLLSLCLLSRVHAADGTRQCPSDDAPTPTPAQEQRLSAWLQLIRATGGEAAVLFRRVDADLGGDAVFATLCADLGQPDIETCEKYLGNRTMGLWLGHGMLALMDQPRAQHWLAQAAARPDMQLMAHSLQVLSGRLTLDQLLLHGSALSAQDREFALRIAKGLNLSSADLPAIDWALRDPEPKVRARALALAADLGAGDPVAEWALVRECGYSGCASALLRQTGPWELLRSDWEALAPSEQDLATQWIRWTPEARRWALAASIDWSGWLVQILSDLWNDTYPGEARQLSFSWLTALPSKRAADLADLAEDHPERQAIASLLETLDLSDPPQRELMLSLASHAVREVSMLAAVQFGIQGDTAQALRSAQMHLAADGSLPDWAVQMLEPEGLMAFGDVLWRTADSSDHERACSLLAEHSDFLVSRDRVRMVEMRDSAIATLLRSPALDWATVDTLVETRMYHRPPVPGMPPLDAALCRYYYPMNALRQVKLTPAQDPAKQIVGHDSPIAHWMLAQALSWYPDERLRPTIIAFRSSGVTGFIEWADRLEQELDQKSGGSDRVFRGQ